MNEQEGEKSFSQSHDALVAHQSFNLLSTICLTSISPLREKEVVIKMMRKVSDQCTCVSAVMSCALDAVWCLLTVILHNICSAAAIITHFHHSKVASVQKFAHECCFLC